jgi:SNF2 family DNA or RNA helicase
MIVNYKFKTKPFDHQIEALRQCTGKKEFGFFMEMGTGKSKVLLDDMARLYTEKEIHFALIIAPKGVYRNWVEKEIPQHFWEDVPIYLSKWSSNLTKALREDISRMIKAGFGKMKVFVMNVEAFSNASGKGVEAANWFGAKYGCSGLIAVDESTTIKNPKSKRTKALLKIAKHFRYKRILTGSPITQSPMDIYSQCEFLKEGMLGFNSFYAFQGRYAVVNQRQMGPRSFRQIIGFKNIEELTNKLGPFTFRVLKENCLDLPKKVYTVRYVTMTPDQEKMYKKIQKEALIMFDNGEIVSTQEMITQMLRLQQILSGHLKTDDGNTVSFPTARMDALIDICQETSGKLIVWSRFRYDIISITKKLKELFGEDSAASFFGDTSEKERQRIIRDFEDKSSKLRFLIGNPSTAGRGLTLNEAKTVVYYANDFDLDIRSQSEDRCHRIGQTSSVLYIDLLCEKTIDEKIINSLKNKIKIGAKVLGEEEREWLEIKQMKLIQQQ